MAIAYLATKLENGHIQVYLNVETQISLKIARGYL